MAFNSKYLLKVGEMGLDTHLWSYDTADAAATVDTSAYFTGDAVAMLKPGDVIIRRTWTVAPPSNVTLSTYGWHIVITNDGTTVDVSDTTVGVMTNTD